MPDSHAGHIAAGPGLSPSLSPASPIDRDNTDSLVASLRAAYGETLAEPLPPALADLLRRLE